MIAAKDSSGRILLMAKEHNLKPLLREIDGTWNETVLTGDDLDHFALIQEKTELDNILKEALENNK